MKDGGPAFPVPEGKQRAGDRIIATSGQFQNPLGYYDGMSLRDWFASVALIGLFSNPAGTQHLHEQLCKFAYNTADAMLREREKE